jgi:hypothetical protein
VLAVGGPGVDLALREAGLCPVRAEPAPAGGAAAQSPAHGQRSEEPLVAVVQGYGAGVAWTDLAEAAYAVQAGALWVATNIDSTLPTDRGMAPGNGALVGAVRQAVATDPVVVGKPHTPLYELSVSVLGTGRDRTLAIGDRLDTDIEGASAAGMSSLFVFGGVHRWADVVGARNRPGRGTSPRTCAPCTRHTRSRSRTGPAGIPHSGCAARHGHGSRSQASLVVSRTGALNERLRASLGRVLAWRPTPWAADGCARRRWGGLVRRA